jgi:hypothetical protein
MPNALDSGMPPPVQAQPGAQGNGLQEGGPPANGAAPQAAPPPPPTHQQTVAALRHFDAIKGELTTLLQDPAIGRSDLRSKIIDGFTKLVSERILPAPQAVQQLGQVPNDAPGQRKWAQTMMAQTVQAEQGIVEHHRNTNLGSGDWATEAAQHHNTKPDDHLHDMAALNANYSGTAR